MTLDIGILPAVTQRVVNQHQSQHGLDYRRRSHTDTWIVPTFGFHQYR
jgi:hypothetical protein